MGLVYRIAQLYNGRSVLPLDDLLQEGAIGLMRAVEKYDPSKGFKFCTYACWWIRSYMQRAVLLDRTVKIPSWAIEKRSKMRRTIHKKQISLDDEAAIDDLVESVYTPGQGSRKTLRMLLKQDLLEFSLDAGLKGYDDDNVTLHAVLADAQAPDPEEDCSQSEQLRLVDVALSRLDKTSSGERKRQIIQERLADRTLDQIGKRLGLSRERVRQIEQKATGELRDIIEVELKNAV